MNREEYLNKIKKIVINSYSKENWTISNSLLDTNNRFTFTNFKDNSLKIKVDLSNKKCELYINITDFDLEILNISDLFDNIITDFELQIEKNIDKLEKIYNNLNKSSGHRSHKLKEILK
jgi:hypothetical protein